MLKKFIYKNNVKHQEYKHIEPPDMIINKDIEVDPEKVLASPLNQYDPTINVAIIGAVSAGKSTLTNALFVELYSDMNIKRTTTMPQVYVETSKTQLKDTDAKHIREYNRQVNKTYMDATTSGTKLNENDIKEVHYAVPKMFDMFPSIPKQTYISVFDLPGLNDAMTKNVYHSYVTNNFYKFDLIIFMIDINSALNTSDEIDILSLILNGIKQNKLTFNIDTKLLVLINKCDDLKKDDAGDMIPQDEEYYEMYNQILAILTMKCDEIYPDIDVSITCVSCEDAYIYRMLKKNLETTLDIKYINKFGSNEYGKTKWNKLDEMEKQKLVVTLFKEFEYNTCIEQCGFTTFNKYLELIFSEQTQITFLMNHIRYALIQILKISESKDPDIISALHSIKQYEKVILSIQKRYNVDKNIYLIKEFTDRLLNTYTENFAKYFNNVYVISSFSDYDIMKKIKYVLECFILIFNMSDEVIIYKFVAHIKMSINKFIVCQINEGIDLHNYIEYGNELVKNNYTDETKTLIFNRLKYIARERPFTYHVSSQINYSDNDLKIIIDVINANEIKLISEIEQIIDIFTFPIEAKLEIIDNIIYDLYCAYRSLSFPLPNKIYYLDTFIVRSSNIFYNRYKQLCNILFINTDKSLWIKRTYPIIVEQPYVHIERYFMKILSNVYPDDVMSKDDLICINVDYTFFTE